MSVLAQTSVSDPLRIRPSPARRIRHSHRRRTPPLPDRGARPFRHQAAVLHSGEWRRSARIRRQGSASLGRAPRWDEDGFLADCHYTRQANQSRSTRTERFELLNPETLGKRCAIGA